MLEWPTGRSPTGEGSTLVVVVVSAAVEVRVVRGGVAVVMVLVVLATEAVAGVVGTVAVVRAAAVKAAHSASCAAVCSAEVLAAEVWPRGS